MKKVLKVSLITVSAILGIIVLLVGSYAIYVFADYYRLDDNLSLEINDKTAQTAVLAKEYTAVSYNVGFGAYSPDFTFFMDGGKESVAKSKEAVYKNINGSMDLLNSFNADFMLIQEVDTNSTRSYHVDQYEMFKDKFDTYDSTMAQNYDSPFLMWPLIKPHGKSVAGLNTMSRYSIESSIRRSLPISTGVSKLVDLDRCFSVNKVPVENGKSLYIYNLHMSAYGGTPEIREAQVNMLFTDIKAKMDNGDYVVCGGDFNHDLTTDKSQTLGNPAGTGEYDWAQPFPFEKLPAGLTFANNYVDNNIPTCRNCDVVYEKGKTLVKIIDGFFVSSNVDSVKVENIDGGFAFSDHNPVVLKFRLK